MAGERHGDDYEADLEVAGQIAQLVNAVGSDKKHKPTSLRLNSTLWKAAELAVASGWAPSLTGLVENALRSHLDEIASARSEDASLEIHYERFPNARPSLSEIVLAAARIDGDHIYNHPDLIESAVQSLGKDADVDSVLAWAAGALDARTRLSVAP